MPDEEPASAASSQPDVTPLKNESLVLNMADCLSFSTAFNLTGFETLNDTLLREMNERAKAQLSNTPANVQDSEAKAEAGKSTLYNAAAITRSPPPTRFSSVHKRELAKEPSISASPHQPHSPSQINSSSFAMRLRRTPSPHRSPGSRARPSPLSPSRPAIPAGRIGAGTLKDSHVFPTLAPDASAEVPSAPPLAGRDTSPKRATTGEDSPAKRRRAPNGAVINVQHSPTSSLAQLRLTEKERLSKISEARTQSRHAHQRSSAQRPGSGLRSPQRALPPWSASRRDANSSRTAQQLRYPQAPNLSLGPVPQKSDEEDAGVTAPEPAPKFVASGGQGGMGSNQPHLPLPRSRPLPPLSMPHSRNTLSHSGHAGVPSGGPRLGQSDPTNPSRTHRPITHNGRTPGQIPRSASARSVTVQQRSIPLRSVSAESGARATPSTATGQKRDLTPTFGSELPSFARPTQATIRRSQSTSTDLHSRSR